MGTGERKSAWHQCQRWPDKDVNSGLPGRLSNAVSQNCKQKGKERGVNVGVYISTGLGPQTQLPTHYQPHCCVWSENTSLLTLTHNCAGNTGGN